MTKEKEKFEVDSVAAEDGAKPVGKALVHARRRLKMLRTVVDGKNKHIAELQAEIERLRVETKRVEDEFDAYKMKHKTPAWVKANKNPDGKKKSAKLGPKVGHPPNRRKVPEVVDREVELLPTSCPDCGEELGDASGWHDHTQVDLPAPAKAVVTKFKVGRCYCANCKREVVAGGRIPQSKYGPRVHAQLAYWKFGLGLTLGKMQKLLWQNNNLSISTGQISEMLSRCGELFEPAYNKLSKDLRAQDHLHADETGWRVSGNNHWLWSFSNAEISVYRIDRTRGQVVVEETLGDTFKGVLNSDFYGAYNAIECPKQKCWTHLLREVRELKKAYPADAEVKTFSARLKTFFKRGKALAASHSSGEVIEKPYSRLFDDTLRFAQREHHHPDLKRLAKRIMKYRMELYTFIHTGTDPTNNAAEREVRPAVLMRKTSYGNRSRKGADTQAIMMSLIRTCSKREINFLDHAAAYLGSQ